MKRLGIVFDLAVCLLGAQLAAAQSAPKEVNAALSSPQLQGKHTARFWGFRIFNAELWTNAAGKFSFDQQFALSISYLYPFSKETLAKSSVEEIARVEGGVPSDHARLEKLLVGCLIDVDKGDRITGVAQGANKIAMYVNGRKNCTMTYPKLRERFFGIWLAPTSRDARGASRLRGQG